MIKKKKLININIHLFKQLLHINQNKKLIGKNKIIFSKNNFIFTKFNKIDMYIYKGNKFRNILINNFFFRQRFGIFCFTRKPFKFILKLKNQNKNIKR